MNFKKSVLMSACALAFTGMTGIAAAAKPTPEPMLTPVGAKPVTVAAAPTRVEPVLIPGKTPVKQATVIRTDDLDETTQRLFARIPATVAPTGFLLERDAPDSIDAVKRLDGSSKAPATSFVEFLKLAANVAGANDLADLEALAKENQRLTQAHSVVPISVMLVNYDTFGDNSDQRVTLDSNQQLRLNTSVADATDTDVLFAVSLDSDAISYLDESFILPSNGFISNMVRPSQVTTMTISIQGSAPQAISFDTPFNITEKFIGAERLTATISLQVAGQKFVAKAVRPYDKPTAEDLQNIFTVEKLQGPVSSRVAASRSKPSQEFSEAKCKIRCYKLDTVDQQIDFRPSTGEDYEKGKIHPMAYPRSETKLSTKNDKLGRTVVFVDGFDIEGNRDHKKLYDKSPDMYPMFHDAGYDVIMLDYEDGTNWIQANGLTVREFLVNHLPHYVDAKYLHETVVVGRSMGGLVSRYAMRTAELNDEDHHAKLFFSLDTPHLGASAPAGIFHLLDWANAYEKNHLFFFGPVKALKSPAAAQQLRKLPNDNDVLVAPEQHIEFMALMQELGLPQETRNIALSNGSGTGSLQTGSERWTDLGESNPSFAMVRANAPLSLTLLGLLPINPDLNIEVDSNHIGRVFSVEKKRRLLGFVIIRNTIEKFVGNEADYIDIAPGGNVSKFGIKVLDKEEVIEAPTFVPTVSSLMYGDPADIFAIPAFDEQLLDKTPFDDVFFDACNTEHATFTFNMKGVVQQELTASAAGREPVSIQKPTARCDEQEPVNLCLRPGEVYGEDGFLRLSEASFDNGFCNVLPIPEGRNAFFNFGINLNGLSPDFDNRAMLIDQLEQTSCPAGSIFTNAGCKIATVSSDAYYSLIQGNDLVIFADLNKVQDCPYNTSLVSKGRMTLRCSLKLATGFDASDVKKVDNQLFYDIETQRACPKGSRALTLPLDGRKVCKLGAIPARTQGVINNGYFAYTGL